MKVLSIFSITSIMVCVLVMSALSCTRKKEKTADLNQQAATTAKASDIMTGLPKLEIPEDNPMTDDKIALGNKLFHDERFSTTGKVSCSTCHAADKFFTDSPLKVSEGINALKGTRNAPTVINSAFNETQFWDGRSPSLEDQALHPFVNPVEMALPNHEPILEVIRKDGDYLTAFKKVFDLSPEAIKIDHVTKAIAAFERTIVEGNSRFDRWFYKGEDILTDQEKKGFTVFMGNGRCVSCHAVEHTTALFTDHNFHNIGVGINRVPQADIERLSLEFLKANYNRDEVDKKVLTDPLTSELGRFAVTKDLSHIGAFKTSTLRNIEKTAPYMHDGSLKTLEEVVEHYNRGGASTDTEKINHFISGGMKPLNLKEDEKKQLVAFLKTLTSPQRAFAGGKK